MKIARLAAQIIWLCVFPVCWATSYYYIPYNGIFYIGADTLMSVMPATNHDPTQRRAALKYEHGCKMLVSNTFVVTPLGWDGEMLFIRDRKGNLVKPVGLVPLYPRIRTILASTKDVDSAFDQFLQAAERTSVELFNYRKKIGVNDVASPNLELAIFYWKSGTVYSRIIQVKSEMKGHEHIVVPTMTKPRALAPNSVEGYGLLDAMLLPPTRTERQRFSSLADIIPYNLSKQSEMTPDSVGPPFTIFKLSPSGGEWSANGSICKSNSFLK